MSWFKKPLNIGITIGAGALLVGSIVGVIYGVLTHSEPGLLEVCWNEDGGVKYVDISQLEKGERVSYGACEGAEKLVWPQTRIPLAVAAVAFNQAELEPGEREREALDVAIQDINRQLGFTILVPTKNRSRADIVVEIGAALGHSKVYGRNSERGEAISPLGYTNHYRNDYGELYCDIVVYSNTGGIRVQYLVIHHELLHAIGLAHDHNNFESAIHPFVVDDTTLDFMRSTRITDHDRELLRSLYKVDKPEFVFMLFNYDRILVDNDSRSSLLFPSFVFSQPVTRRKSCTTRPKS
jgi:hypothetical protein